MLNDLSGMHLINSSIEWLSKNYCIAKKTNEKLIKLKNRITCISFLMKLIEQIQWNFHSVQCSETLASRIYKTFYYFSFCFHECNTDASTRFNFIFADFKHSKQKFYNFLEVTVYIVLIYITTQIMKLCKNGILFSVFFLGSSEPNDFFPKIWAEFGRWVSEFCL